MVSIIGLVGLLTLDKNICGDVIRSGIGGSIYYISRVFKILGTHFKVLTAVGRDFPLSNLFEECGEEPFTILVYGGDNLVFENLYESGGRLQRVRNYGYKFLLEDILRCFCGDKPLLLGLVPVLGELLPSDVLVLSRHFDVALDPQGLVRLVRDGRVVGTSVNPRYLMPCKIIKLSRDEIRYLFSDYAEFQLFIDYFDGILSITLGVNGSIIISGGEAVYIPTIPVEGLVDTTGAGDVYLAGLLHGYVNRAGVVESGVLASSLSYALISGGIDNVGEYKAFTEVISSGVESLPINRIDRFIQF